MARGPHQLKFNNLFNMHFSWLIFFKDFVRKIWLGYRRIVIEKWCNRWLRLHTMLFLQGSDLHCAGSWHFGDFSNIFLPNIGEVQKKSYHLSAGPLHCAIW